jgi:hypothetical protein
VTTTVPVPYLTFDQIEAKVRELAEANPDFIYWPERTTQTCTYVPDDVQPACIFGQAFTALGVPMEFLAEHATAGINEILESMHIATTPRQREWAAVVQRRQDSKARWVRAVADADHHVDAYYPAVAS